MSLLIQLIIILFVQGQIQSTKPNFYLFGRLGDHYSYEYRNFHYEYETRFILKQDSGC